LLVEIYAPVERPKGWMSPARNGFEIK
jgi:hypothetical protein